MLKFNRYEKTDGGLRIAVYDPAEGLGNPAGLMPFLRVTDDTGPWSELFDDFLQEPDVDRITGLSVGMWNTSIRFKPPVNVIESLVAAAPQLPELKVLFLGHILHKEHSLAWIDTGDLSPLWEAFPLLTRLRIRGTQGLTLGKIQHDFLEELVIESGGMPANVVQEITAASLPRLRHLELFLGRSSHGYDATHNDIKALLNHKLFPKLKHLALRYSEYADAMADLISDSPQLVKKLDSLDMSLGTLSADGGWSLLECDTIESLKNIDLHHHSMTKEVMEQFQFLPGTKVDVSRNYSRYGGGDGRLYYFEFME